MSAPLAAMPASRTPSEKTRSTTHRVMLHFVQFIFACFLFTFLLTLALIIHRHHYRRQHLPQSSASHPDTVQAWMRQINTHPYTVRRGCREYDAGAQSCVFTGLACINVSQSRPFARPSVYLLHDTFPDRRPVPSDRWCQLRHQSSDPRYFASRHWPIMQHTFAPQRSCLNAEFRTSASLLPHLRSDTVKWLPSLWLIDLDNIRNDHNNHLLKDILWMLDVQLWQQSIDPQSSPFHAPIPRLFDGADPNDITPHIYLPQGRADFVTQTARDVNRLIYSLVLRLDITPLYANTTPTDLQTPRAQPRTTSPLFTAYPTLRERLVFHRDQLESNHTTLVCTPRLTVGAKIGNGAHERVCRNLRQRSHQAFGIVPPPKRRLGRIFYQQPPKRVMIVQRHITRRLGNLEELETALRAALARFGVAVEVVDTRALQTAEEQVRTFARAGVVVTPHGSQAMGLIFMPRHSALVEIMPLGYTDYAFNLLADSCRVWYYELQGKLGNRNGTEFVEMCGERVPHMMSPCTEVKFKAVWVDVEDAVKTVSFALERIGYPIGDWLAGGRRR